MYENRKVPHTKRGAVIKQTHPLLRHRMPRLSEALRVLMEHEHCHPFVNRYKSEPYARSRPVPLRAPSASHDTYWCAYVKSSKLN